MFQRLFLFIVAGVGGYVLTVVAAFVFWSWTGASGPDPTPLLVVLFIIAPVVGVVCGVYGASRPTRRNPPKAPGGAWPARWGNTPSPAREPPDHWPPGRPWPPSPGYGKWQIAVAVAGALLVGAILVANKLTNDRVPLFPHIPHVPR